MDSKAVLDIFKEITRIPRESGHEEPMTAYLVDWAKSRGLECRKDRTGNIMIAKPAAPGKEDVPAIVLQAHQDMVCEKNAGVVHDFSKDPIKYVIEDGWMIARETTLGADDGIGIAACLAILGSDLPAGRVECVFTISEETGMDGAFAMKKGFFTGKTLINLDSEDEGQLFIGCAGGQNTKATFACGTEPVHDGWKCLKLTIDGAIGGHSGDDINKERANTVQQMFRFLHSELAYGLQLVTVNGGGKSNAIARECAAEIAVPDTDASVRRFKAFGKAVKAEFHTTDPGLRFKAATAAPAVDAAASEKAGLFISGMFAAPHGVVAMSQDIPGLVETSTNLASVKETAPGTFVVATSQRSSVESAKRMIGDKVAAAFRLAGAEVEAGSHYPGWKPDVDSHILKVCVESYRRLFHVEPEVKAIHAGLECGLFLDKFKGLDMISFGPTLRGVHAPGEKLDLASMDKFVQLLEDVVVNFN